MGGSGSGPAALASRRPAGARLGRWLSDHLVLFAAILVIAFLCLPIAVVVLLSFNQPPGRFNYTFQQFTFDNWLHPCRPAGLCASVGKSIQIGFLVTVISTAVGTLMAFALARHRFHGRTAVNLLIFVPMASPEVVMGSSLLTLFVAASVIPLGFWTILIAHVLFCISFVVVTVKARIAVLDPMLEQAALDLYASEWQAFRRVTLPLVAPGIVAAALLAFSLSFDDFIITNFNSGRTVTFPIFVWGAVTRGIPPQVNVIGTMMFLVALIAVLAGQLAGRRRRGKT